MSLITNLSKLLVRISNPRYFLNIILFGYLNKHQNQSFSQEGEDRILFSIFGPRTSGFYVDVGAHHPRRFSNTFLFYNLGWRGINIDASKEAIRLFKVERKRDINIHCGIGSRAGYKQFIVFDEPAVSTFNKAVAQDKVNNTKFRVRSRVKVPIRPLSQVLRRHLKSNQVIDFLSIDVEGNDFEVLKSNNWKKYRPLYIAIEIYGVKDFNTVLQDPVTFYLAKHHYAPIAKTLNTVIYKRIQ